MFPTQSLSPKVSLELGAALTMTCVRALKSRVGRGRSARIPVGTVESSVATAHGRIELVRARHLRSERSSWNPGFHCRYAVVIDGSHRGHVTAWLDRGTDSAVVVAELAKAEPGASEASEAEVLVGILDSLIAMLVQHYPWVLRVSIALPSDSSAAADRVLRLHGFDCEGTVPGYIADRAGTRRQFWTRTAIG